MYPPTTPAGVSNFDLDQLQQLLSHAHTKPSVVQLNADPLNPNLGIQAFCRTHGIQFQAYSSLGTQWAMRQGRNPVLGNGEIMRIGRARGRSAAQVVLRWALQHGQVR